MKEKQKSFKKTQWIWFVGLSLGFLLVGAYMYYTWSECLNQFSFLMCVRLLLG